MNMSIIYWSARRERLLIGLVVKFPSNVLWLWKQFISGSRWWWRYSHCHTVNVGVIHKPYVELNMEDQTSLWNTHRWFGSKRVQSNSEKEINIPTCTSGNEDQPDCSGRAQLALKNTAANPFLCALATHDKQGSLSLSLPWLVESRASFLGTNFRRLTTSYRPDPCRSWHP